MTASPAHTIRIVIADKSPIVQSGLRQLFEKHGQFHIVATATDGERFLEAVERLTFDVGVIGWDMPYFSGEQVLTALREQENPPRILVYTGNSDPEIPRQVMALGGAGFCNKSDPPKRIADTVIAVAAGQMVFPFMDLRESSGVAMQALTTREQEFLTALTDGRGNAQLAKDFGLSLNTVKFHLKNLFDKLGVDNRTQAVAKFLKTPRRK